MNLILFIMSSLTNYGREHPAAVSAVGATGGLTGLYVSFSENLLLVFKLISGAGGALLVILSILFVLPRFLRFMSNWRKYGFRKADYDSTPPFTRPPTKQG